MTDNEQWKTDGDCNKCRKQSYCNRQCTALKRRKQNILAQFATNVILNREKTESQNDKEQKN